MPPPSSSAATDAPRLTARLLASMTTCLDSMKTARQVSKRQAPPPNRERHPSAARGATQTAAKSAKVNPLKKFRGMRTFTISSEVLCG